jgi:hypothetical protein
LQEKYGIAIKSKLQIKNIILLIGKDREIIILPQNLNKSESCVEFFVILKHFFNKININCRVFGLFFDINLNLIRKKIKEDFLKNFSEINLISLLNDSNLETYYQNNYEGEEILGIEIRFNSEFIN